MTKFRQSDIDDFNCNSIFNGAKTGYEAKVVAEALQRAGKNPQLHGHIHEILIRDRINMNPITMIKGETARLVKSTNAKTVDLVVERGGTIVRRIQAKDTADSLHKTIRQINKGQYQSAEILGTKETAENFLKHASKVKGAKTIKSSGISSKTTKTLAARAGAGGTAHLGRACLGAARSGGLAGLVVGGGISLIKGCYEMAEGTADFEDVAAEVGKNCLGAGLSGASASVAATATGAMVATGAAALGLTGLAVTATIVAAPVVAAVGVGLAVGNLWEEFCDSWW